MTVQKFADYLITKPDLEAGDNITHLKLQKLLYYAQGWHLALNGTPLFEEPLEAWAHGPVVPVVYDRFKEYSDAALPLELATDASQVTTEQAAFLDELWDVYGGYSTKKLEELTHREAPWINARGDRGSMERCNEMISHEAMNTFFTSIKD